MRSLFSKKEPENGLAVIVMKLECTVRPCVCVSFPLSPPFFKVYSLELDQEDNYHYLTWVSCSLLSASSAHVGPDSFQKVAACLMILKSISDEK